MSVDQRNEDQLLASSTMSSTDERPLLRSPDPDCMNDVNTTRMFPIYDGKVKLTEDQLLAPSTITSEDERFLLRSPDLIYHDFNYSAPKHGIDPWMFPPEFPSHLYSGRSFTNSPEMVNPMSQNSGP